MDYFGFLKQPKRNAGTNTLIENNHKISWKFHYQRQIHVTVVRLSRFLFFFFFFSFHFCTEAINLSFWINGDENVLKSTFTDFKHGGITVYDELTDNSKTG